MNNIRELGQILRWAMTMKVPLFGSSTPPGFLRTFAVMNRLPTEDERNAIERSLKEERGL